MTDRERIWRNIRETACQYEAPSHLSDTQLLAIAKKLEPFGPLYAADAPAFGMTQLQWIELQE